MAVLVEGISVVVRASSIHARYPGGWPRFRDDVPNGTLCADGELVRVGFMNPADVERYIQQLTDFNLVYLLDGHTVDVVVADQRRGFTVSCAWAEFGRIDWKGDAAKQIAACRLLGSKRTQVLTPDGWTFDESLSAQYLFVEDGWVCEFMEFLRHENGLDVYRDLRSGREVYVGRAGDGIT